MSTKRVNSKDPNLITLTKGESFAYREVFHDEHIIPINVIINELLKLSNLNYQTVVEILSKISVCKMLKTEDRSIYNARKRVFDVNEIIETTYLEANIYVKDYPYNHMNKITEDDILKLGSIDLTIPKETIVEFFPHPESYGYKMALFPNRMYTDVYENGDGDYYSKTNDVELINYIMFLQKVFAKPL